MIGAECERDYLLTSLQMKVRSNKRQLRLGGCTRTTLNPLRAETHRNSFHASTKRSFFTAGILVKHQLGRVAGSDGTVCGARHQKFHVELDSNPQPGFFS